ncbi:MAG: pyridoxal 5'-phosphate synthase [Bacteroidota bacterium]
MQNPFNLFQDWYQQELALSKVRIPSACCFTTNGPDGFPNSRFVSLKEIKEESFVITGPLNSQKGREIEASPKVSIIFWWTETEKQVRIQGIAEKIPESAAEAYFSKRNRDSQIVSTVFDQGEEIAHFEELTTRFESGKAAFGQTTIAKPTQWSGFYVKPVRIEFMEFMQTRLHRRTLFMRDGGAWKKTYLQP